MQTEKTTIIEKPTVYILVNPLFDHLVKIGFTKNLKRRVNDFNSQTGIPSNYYCYAAYYCGDKITDTQIHKAIDAVDPSLRLSSNKEFYKMAPQKAYDILVAIATINDSASEVVFNPLDDDFINRYAANNNIVYEDSDIWYTKCHAIREKFSDNLLPKDKTKHEKKPTAVSLQATTKALADPTRREILQLLKNGRMAAGDIAAKFNMTGASISRHLSVLRDADLIRDERDGKFIYYELNTTVLDDFYCWIISIIRD